MKIDYSKIPLSDANEVKEYQPFWEGTRKGILQFPCCSSCNKFHWYPMVRCPYCRSQEIKWVQSKGKGKIFSWSIVRYPFFPPVKESLPFNVALVELDDVPGVRLVTNIIDCEPDKLRIGLPVEVIFHPVEGKLVLPLFRPNANQKVS
jgi:uncharacterized OB-fold protein